MNDTELTNFGGDRPLVRWVAVERNFQRSLRLDRDVASAEDMLAGYVAQGTSRQALEAMALGITGSKQRSYTWTGPYGCGKSSLALLLCALTGTPEKQSEAKRILKLFPDEPLAVAFAAKEGWNQLILVGRQGSLTSDLAESLGVPADGRAVVKALEARAAKQHAPDAFLLVIDELGQYLESAQASENAYLLQEIAEAANRSEAKFVLLGILHQAVDVYASRLPRSVRDEWAKVQGRFTDIPLVSSSEETVELLGHALARPMGEPPEDKKFERAVKQTAQSITERRPEVGDRIEEMLRRCWPLNPVTTILLGPISRRKFAQNERSIYSFLSASEPLGFRNFVEHHVVGETFSPADYWDYLKENFETSILTTGEGHRWLTAIDAIHRAELVGDELLVRLAKSVALIDLFRTGSGVEATLPVLSASVGVSEDRVRTALKVLAAKKVVIERRFADAWAVFAGSDFDIEASFKEAMTHVTGVDTALLNHFVTMTPIVAREYYLRMGSLRWFERRVIPVEQLSHFCASKTNFDGAVGAFVLLLPESRDDQIDADRLETIYAANGLSPTDARNLVLGTAPAAFTVRELLLELQALSLVEKEPALEGDETGRAEVKTRVKFVTEALQDALASAFVNSVWVNGSGRPKEINRAQGLTDYASFICDGIFKKAPEINNELINRDYLSSQIRAAQNELLRHMVTNEHEENLGFSGFPPAYALYLSLLKNLHLDHGGYYSFEAPDLEDEDSNYGPLWKSTIEFLQCRPMTEGKDLFTFWSKPPFGLKAGVMPVLALAFYLTCKQNIAVYLNGAFQPAMTAATVDEWMVDPSRISFRWINLGAEHEDFIKALAYGLKPLAKMPIEESLLGVARGIVAVVLRAPKWTQHSTSFTAETLKMKSIVLKASDPVQLLFKDLPAVYGVEPGVDLARGITNSLEEFVAGMPNMLRRVRAHLFAALDADRNDLGALRRRAQNIKGKSGGTMLEAFIARIMNFNDRPGDVEGVISLACGRPAQFWTDREIEAALSKITDFAIEFRKQEVFAPLRGGEVKRRYVGIAFSSGAGSITEEIELNEAEEAVASDRGAQILDLIKGLPRNVALAALSNAGVNLAPDKKKEGA